MAEIEMYTTKFCPYCMAAKRLLKSKDAAYKEIDVSFNQQLRSEMTKKSNGRTSVPQIWIDGRHVGGFDDLNALNSKGELDQLLAS